MGTSVSYSCECGFSGSANMGGGRMTYQELDLFPAYCEKCEDVVEVNLFADLTCPNCAGPVVPYSDPSLRANSEEKDVQNSAKFSLLDGDYKCPKCGKMSLHFEDGDLFWD